MPEWSKGPDSSKICFLKNSRFLVDNVCVGSNPTFSIFFFKETMIEVIVIVSKWNDHSDAARNS